MFLSHVFADCTSDLRRTLRELDTNPPKIRRVAGKLARVHSLMQGSKVEWGGVLLKSVLGLLGFVASVLSSV